MPRCHRVTRRAECQKATTELSLQNLQSLSHLHYPMDTRQLTSSQGEADGVSDRGMTLQALGGGEFALQLVPRQRAAAFYRRARTHTHHADLQVEVQIRILLKDKYRKLCQKCEHRQSHFDFLKNASSVSLF